MEGRKFALTVTVLTLVYWLLSGGLTFFNKWFFSTRGFHFPIFVVMGTFAIHSIITFALRTVSSVIDEKSHVHLVLPNRQTVTKSLYFRYLTVIGLCTGLEIASSNLALVRLSVSFHTMVHASKPIFIAGWSVAMGLERADWKLFAIVGVVAMGVIMLSLGESSIPVAITPINSTVPASNTASEAKMEMGEMDNLEDRQNPPDPGFDPNGFALILFSCFCSGARWSLAQVMLQKVELRDDAGGKATEKLTPFNLIYYIAPIGFAALLPFFLAFEADRLQEYLRAEPTTDGDLVGFELIISAWSLLLSLTEFYFVRFTSGLVLSFLAISKELLLIIISVMVNGDMLPALNVVGFLFCIAGIVAYHRRTHFHEQSYQAISTATSGGSAVAQLDFSKNNISTNETTPIKRLEPSGSAIDETSAFANTDTGV